MFKWIKSLFFPSIPMIKLFICRKGYWHAYSTQPKIITSGCTKKCAIKRWVDCHDRYVLDLKETPDV